MNTPPTGTLEHPALGLLRYERRVGGYEGAFAAGETRVTLTVDDAREVEDVIAHADRVLSRFGALAEKALDYAAARLAAGLLGPMSAHEIRAKLALGAVTVYPDGEISWWHRDGDLFGGHPVVVAMDADDICFDLDVRSCPAT